MADLELRGRVLFKEFTGELDWWQTAVIYQIYPRSFQDSNGDGIGDFTGIRQRLGYLKDLGIDAIWLSPFYNSPMKDFGYDIANYREIEPMFGPMADFEAFMKDAHNLGFKVILDYVPNHTSDQHEWFKRSRSEGPNGQYANYYVWHDGKVVNGKRHPPNNWLSVFSGSAWTWDPTRNQYYLHQFLKEQPDLNWRNPKVQKDMQNVFQFWLDKGVDGFRIDAIGQLFEDRRMPDEPKSDRSDLPGDDYFTLDHTYTFSQQETYDMTFKWREFFNKYQKQHNRHHIFMITEMYDEGVTKAVKFYNYGPDYPFNFNLCFLTPESDGFELYKLVSSWLELMPDGKWPNWVVGNHDRPRISSLKGVEFCDAANGLLLLLPGTPTTYYGEELGLENIHVSYQDTQDPFGKNQTPERYQLYSRDPSRSPMQWNTDANAGFTSESVKPWLPVHPNYKTTNVEEEWKNPTSHLNVYKKLVSLRKSPVFRRGAMICCVVNAHVFSFVRYSKGFAPYVVIISVHSDTSKADFSMELDGEMFRGGKIVIQTNGSDEGETVAVDALQVPPKSLTVIELQQAE